MKKTLLLSMLILSGLGASAQMPNGSVAPDFTATDLNEQQISLYADFLNQGKSVIIDFSATWCGPCWSYHQTHAMADFYEAYGTAGSNEVGVIFVEADINNTVTQNLYGIPGPQTMTQGNWVDGSPYPIIEDNATIDIGAPNKFNINFFPTLYRICDGTKLTRLLDPAVEGSAAQLKAIVNTECQTLVGLANHGRVEAASKTLRLCPGATTADVQAKIKNFGNNNITSATLVLKQGENVVATTEYTGNLAQFATPATVTFDDVALAAGEYWIEMTNINGATPARPEMTVADMDVVVSEETPNNIVVNVFTDDYPGEIIWRIKNSSGALVASGGPYAGNTGGAAGGPDANTTKVHNITLPAGVDCYTVELIDIWGDGWSSGNSTHGLEIYSANGLVFQALVGNFGQIMSVPAAFKSMGALGQETIESTSFSIYPNPSNGVFTFNTPETVSVVVTDLTGKTVFTANNIENGMSIDMGSLQSGVYIAKVTGASSERIEKLIIK